MTLHTMVVSIPISIRYSSPRELCSSCCAALPALHGLHSIAPHPHCRLAPLPPHPPTHQEALISALRNTMHLLATATTLMMLMVAPPLAAAQPPPPPSSSSCSIQTVFAGLSDIKSDPDCQSGCNSAVGDGSWGGGTCRADWTPGPHDTCNAACGRVFEPFWVRHCPRGLLSLDSLHLAPRARARVAGLVRRHADERQHGRDARDGAVLRSLPRDAV
eukprot:SAG31_NODE_8074_length_1527_cov_6.789216_1_plen_216_part_10